MARLQDFCGCIRVLGQRRAWRRRQCCVRLCGWVLCRVVGVSVELPPPTSWCAVVHTLHLIVKERHAFSVLRCSTYERPAPLSGYAVVGAPGDSSGYWERDSQASVSEHWPTRSLSVGFHRGVSLVAFRIARMFGNICFVRRCCRFCGL